jgi:hypothetical protein
LLFFASIHSAAVDAVSQTLEGEFLLVTHPGVGFPSIVKGVFIVLLILYPFPHAHSNPTPQVSAIASFPGPHGGFAFVIPPADNIFPLVPDTPNSVIHSTQPRSHLLFQEGHPDSSLPELIGFASVV